LAIEPFTRQRLIHGLDGGFHGAEDFFQPLLDLVVSVKRDEPTFAQFDDLCAASPAAGRT